MNCAKINTCDKIMTILDKDMFDFQYIDCINNVCNKCDGKESLSMSPPLQTSVCIFFPHDGRCEIDTDLKCVHSLTLGDCYSANITINKNAGLIINRLSDLIALVYKLTQLKNEWEHKICS